MLRTIALLVFSNIFMTIVWCGFLRKTEFSLWKAIPISWGIALFGYCLMIPANRYGILSGHSGFQLKIVQEIITLVIFTLFAVIYLKEPLKINYLYSFICILGAVYFAFRK